ncbi:hypothetical protein IMSAG049_01479 [Clostridiales bacterium]|nr:hypothetical protein IMSAG049_01479 [Clostridiales bacterium]
MLSTIVNICILSISIITLSIISRISAMCRAEKTVDTEWTRAVIDA